MTTLHSVTAILGKDFKKLDGPDNYNEWFKAFEELAFLNGYSDIYNGQVTPLLKPELPTFATPRPQRSTRSHPDGDIVSQITTSYLPNDAANQLAVYRTQLENWKEFDKTSRSATALLRAAVEP